MDPAKIPMLIGAVLMALSVIALNGWYFSGWTAVDPFLSTLVFLAGPFFIGMGVADPQPKSQPGWARLEG